ncbi:hypothetical protein M404DRAFT_160058, partial [Pisolithus tinctorius Marx 270]
WLDSMAGLHAILSGALHIMHLKMYLHGLTAAVWQDKDMQAILPIWNSIYSSMSLMVNQNSPPHKDTNGQKVWLDTLLTVRRYAPLDFIVPELGMQFRYNSGTVLAMSGVALVHQVDGTDGDQACCQVQVYPQGTRLQDRVTGGKSEWPKSRLRDRGQVRLDQS